MSTIYDFTVKDTEGNDVSLDMYKGDVILVVNTATGCGFTPQYEGLERLYLEFQDKGFVVLDFPCNQFGHQAPGTDKEIKEFCQVNYHTTFPTFAKIEVNGPNEAPLYKWLKESKGGLFSSNIKWNFTKFLIDRDGNVVDRFAPTVKPEDIEEKVAHLVAGED